ncbi:outer membrane beta-barrel protein [Pedobacter frigoris]|uniref:outer membrane beta-barrel protein n=1 Tax=Pedobacter frigoris TaxID=2571272 RepID=UPI00292D6E18|nr:outer membrane beta-barrel protein [Pedobacter frigoris]
MLKSFFLVLLLTLAFHSLYAQKANIQGVVTDSVETKGLQNCSVLLIRSSDSILVKTVRTDAMGKFVFNNLSKGNYTLLVTYPKMADFITTVSLSDTSSVNLGKISMDLKSKLLNEVVIQATKRAIRMKGDTLVFQADSFAVRSNANVQELLKRLPGIVVNPDGSIKAQGKKVETVLVDGDEFFGDDPLLATKYLKANAVDEIQVYDKKSKNAELTGIDDGIKNKTINIKLKENAKNGYISTLDANAGTNQFRDYGGMFGVFKNKLKAAVFGTSSNLDNQSKISNSMRKLKGEDYDIIQVGDDGSSIMYSTGMEDDDDYYSGGAGLPNNLNIGAHFSDKFYKNKMGIKLNAKGFDYKSTNRETSHSTELLPNGNVFVSSGNNQTNTKTAGENIKAGYNFSIDSLTTLRVAFGAKKSRNNNNSIGYTDTRTENGFFISQNNQENTGSGEGEGFNGNINWSKRFKKKGRTLSVDVQPESQNNNSIEQSINTTSYYDDGGNLSRTEKINLNKDNSSSKNSLGARINYTEPISKNWAMEASYSFKTISSNSYLLVSDNVIKKIDSLSNNFKFINFSNVGRIVMQYRVNKFSISTGMEATRTSFELKDLDRKNDFNRKYLNLAPSTNINYRMDGNKSLSLNYNGYMQQPSIDQLQPVRQLNNPLLQVIGNSALRPSFTNNFSLYYSGFQFKSEEYISGGVNYGFTTNGIVNTEIVDEFNKRISSYTNLNGINSLSGNLGYSKGFTKLNFRLGVDVGFNTSNRLSIINFTTNKTRNNQYNLRSSFSYYTPKLDLSYSPSANFMYGSSSIGGINDGKSLTHNHEFSGTMQLPYHFEFNSTISLSYRPANASFDKDLDIAIWNCYLSTKLLKSESLEIKLTVTDILNQKIGYDRFVGGNVISENTYSYIPRYALLGINWNLSGNFNTKSSK